MYLFIIKTIIIIVLNAPINSYKIYLRINNISVSINIKIVWTFGFLGAFLTTQVNSPLFGISF